MVNLQQPIAITLTLLFNVTIALAAIYSLIFVTIGITFLFASKRAGMKALADTANTTSFSILIAARNEEINLPRLLQDLQNQNYPRDRFEVIVVDDHSEKMLSQETLRKSFPALNLSVQALGNDQEGKKKALAVGSELAKGEYLLFTDADCRVGTQWILSFSRLLETKHPELVIGMVDYLPGSKFFSAFYRLDFLAMIVSGVSLARLGLPVLCNGANLAVKRSVYQSLREQMPEETPSGDDVFLLHAAAHSGKKIEVAFEKDSLVWTDSPESIHEFLNQRSRWASKAKYYKSIPAIALAVLVVVGNIGFVLSLTGMVFSSVQFWILPAAPKIMADCLLLTIGLNYFGRRRQLLLFPVAQLIYPFYVLYSFMFSLRGFSWKNRKYQLMA